MSALTAVQQEWAGQRLKILSLIPNNSAKLLGIQIEDSQKRKIRITGTVGVVSTLNQRLYLTFIHPPPPVDFFEVEFKC